jgi:hypothetical protein
MRTREALQALVSAGFASPSDRSELVELAIRLIVKEALGRMSLTVLAGSAPSAAAGVTRQPTNPAERQN